MGLDFWQKIRHFTPKHLLKILYFSLFNSDLIYGWQIWGQDQSEEFKKIEKLQEKAIRIVNFLPLNATVEKQMYEMNILKLKDFIMLQNILTENALGSFNDKFHSSKLPLNHTRSSSTYQLKVNNFIIERYAANQLWTNAHYLGTTSTKQKILKQNFKWWRD